MSGEEHTHETGGAWHVTRWVVPGCPACTPLADTASTGADVEARFVSSAQEMLGRDFVDAILTDVFQGKRDHLREHMLGMVAKVSRRHPWPYFEECVESEVQRRLAAHDAATADRVRRETAEGIARAIEANCLHYGDEACCCNDAARVAREQGR